MSRKRVNTLLRLEPEYWQAAVEQGSKKDRSANWICADWVRRGAALDGVTLAEPGPVTEAKIKQDFEVRA